MTRLRAASNNRYRYVKRRPTKHGARWQARAWMAYPLGCIYLGSFDTEREAWECVIQWVRRGADPVRDLPEGCLPKWVYRCEGGYLAKMRQDRLQVQLGPYPTPEAAFLAALQCWEYRGWSGVNEASPFRLVDPRGGVSREMKRESGRGNKRETRRDVTDSRSMAHV